MTLESVQYGCQIVLTLAVTGVMCAMAAGIIYGIYNMCKEVL